MARRGGSHDYMMRSEKRPSARPAGAPPNRSRRKKSRRHPLYAFITVLLLIVLYPVGLVMLWVRKLRWRSITKLMLSLVTGVVFFVLCAFALNAQVDNEAITDLQTNIKQQLTHVTSAVRTAVSNKEEVEHNLTVLGPRIIDLTGNAVAQATIQAVPQVGENLNTLYRRAGRMSRDLIKYIDREGRELLYAMGALETPKPTLAPVNTPTPTATPEATPTPTPRPTDPPPEPTAEPSESDAATAEPTGVAAVSRAEPTDSPTVPPSARPTVVPTATPTVRPAVAPTAGPPTRVPVQSVAPESGGVSQSPVLSVAVSPTPVTPTARPTPTPVPTPSPTPIILPDIKPFGLTTVYYYDSGRSYHTSPTCSGMSNAPAHTLAEAAEAGKRRCGNCNPPELSLIDAEMIVWCGEDDVFHITDECAALTEQWSALPFDEAWLEDGMTGCALCGADLYVESRRVVPAATPVPAPIT